jgi:hypothetical protein
MSLLIPMIPVVSFVGQQNDPSRVSFELRRPQQFPDQMQVAEIGVWFGGISRPVDAKRKAPLPTLNGNHVPYRPVLRFAARAFAHLLR